MLPAPQARAHRRTQAGEPAGSNRISSRPTISLRPTYSTPPVPQHPVNPDGPAYPQNDPQAPDYVGDRGAFAARSPSADSYKSPATPATMAASAKLKTYQLKWMVVVVM